MKNFYFLFVFIGLSLFTAFTVSAQGVGINSSGNSADPSAILDVSANNKGALMPRMTEAERNAITNPALGLQIFNTTTNCFNFWIGTTWKQLCGDCDFNSPLAGNNGPICQGSTLGLTATTILGAIYQWAGPNGFTSILQNPSILNATVAASGAYSVTATKNGCTSTPQSTVATVNEIPATPVVGNSGPGCVGNVLNLTASTISGATYSWSGPNSYSVNIQNPTINNVQLTDAGTYSISAMIAGCTSALSTTSVIINTIPAMPGSINGNTSACANSSGNAYSINSVSGATTYNWTVPSGATISSGQGTTSITVAFGSTSGNVTVTAGNICGNSLSSSINISIAGGGNGSQAFSYSGSNASFIVPACVTSINVKLWGAGGGGGTDGGGSSHPYAWPGGGGGYATGTIAVTPGENLIVIVGGAGGVLTGGFGGGGSANSAEWRGGGGGGRSAIRRGSDELVTAAGGGGGGGGSINGKVGGAGGGIIGNDGEGGATSGGGGTQSAGGAAGIYGGPNAGSQFQGGNGGNSQNSGGGGGGGYYGGGGGSSGGDSSTCGAGGGGSSYINGTGVSGGNTSGGSGQTPGNNSDPARTGAGAGGNGGQSGSSGIVIISW